jgi:hypothetical protein
MLSSQNVTFTDQNPAYQYSVVSEPDSTFGIADNNDADLGEFFSRPIKIAEYQWSTSVVFFEDFNPWTLFFTNPRVINRISNFNLLRAKLHVKFVINGNGFYYGRMLASYQPLHNQDEFTLNRALVATDLIEASQRPHVYLDPTSNQGGTLCLPYFFYKDNLSIPLGEWDQMGLMNMRELNGLAHANGSTQPINISVFAWATEVALSVPTSSEPSSLVPQSGFEPQSGNKKKKPRVTVTKQSKPPAQQTDEYGSGIVSGPASTIARIAGMLTQAPMIGPYAKATQMAANAVGGIAKMFGYSRAPTLEPIQELVPRYLGNMATANMPDNVQKLTLDAKQELTVDGRTVGLSSMDEMSIKSMACRESFLCSTIWTTSQTADSHLFSAEVSPTLWDVYFNGVNNEVHQTCCSYAVVPFYYWRGSMKFRFQIVASNFHKGRLKVQWDPFASAGYEYNTQYTHVIDIAEDKDFTMEIGWGSTYGWLRHRSPGTSLRTWTTGATPVATTPNELANGIIKLSVVNDLTTVNDSFGQLVYVNVFVSAGDDFEVRCPDSLLISNFSVYNPNSGFEPQSGVEDVIADIESTNEPSAPQQMQVLEQMGNKLDETDPSTYVYFGEEITSFRQCLKRYNLFSFLPIATASVFVNLYQHYFPYYYGETTDGAFGDPVNLCKMTLLNYLAPCYQGYRGGLRWKFIQVGSNNGGFVGTTTISRERPETDFPRLDSQAVTFGSDTATRSSVLYRYPHGWDGAMLTPQRQQPVVEAEIPYFRNLRFTPARRKNLSNNPGGWQFANLFRTSFYANGTTSVPTQALSMVAAGEDFNFYFFTNTPILYVYVYTP